MVEKTERKEMYSIGQLQLFDFPYKIVNLGGLDLSY